MENDRALLVKLHVMRETLDDIVDLPKRSCSSAHASR